MRTVIIFVLLFIAASSNAQSLVITDGNSLADGLRLYEKGLAGASLTPKERYSASAAVGYIQGFLGACGTWAVVDKENYPIRFPREGVEPIQGIKVVEKFLADHPEDLHSIADGLCLVALTKAFPNPDRR